MRMTLDQLRVFVAVAERQHVTRAAEALSMAQSAASAAVVALETRYGIRLFNRVGRGIELTEAGRRFLMEARAVLVRAEAAELMLAELSGLVKGSLSVWASQTIASYWLPRYLVAFRRAHPGIEIRLTIGNTAQVAAAVHEGLAEIGFVEGAVEDGLLSSTTVATDQLVLVVAADHLWAAKAELTLRDAAEQGEWVLREPGSGTRSAFEAALAAAGIPLSRLRITLELPSNEAVRAAVESGMGATVISASVAVSSLEAGLLHRVALALPEREFHVLRHRERHPSGATEALLSLITATTPRSGPAG